MRSPERHAELIAFVILCCFVRAPAQNQPAPTNSSVTLPSSLLGRELTTLDHHHLKLSDYSDQIVVLNVCAPWSPPCREYLPYLNRIGAIYEKRVQVIEVVAKENDPGKILQSVTRELKIRFPVVLDDIGFSESIRKLVNGRSVTPQTLLIGKQGRILSYFEGYNNVETPSLLQRTLDEATREIGGQKPHRPGVMSSY